jgi:creatinine amidohydrolase/Fe(II)-dependent formamide hydrolase-like protein
MSAAQPGFIGDVKQAHQFLQKAGMKAVSKIGVIGDPRLATADMGKETLEELSIEIAHFVKKNMKS